MPAVDIHETFMRVAFTIAQMSYAEKRKVGCVIAKNENIIAVGYNGTPKGQDNVCEDENFKTKDSVLHAESNALAKCMRSTVSSEGAIMYVTLSPCVNCANNIIQSGISELYFQEEHKCDRGLILIFEAGIKVTKL